MTGSFLSSSPTIPHGMTRRTLVMGLPVLAAGCATQGPIAPLAPYADPYYVAMYAAMPQERFPIPAVNIARVDPQFYRQEVAYSSPETPGTIVIDPRQRFLYLTREGGRAVRYGVGVGQAGLEWSGRATIRRKAEWPTWTPTRDMIARDPRNAEWANGMEPGLQNPLGARALYLYEGGRDTLYRIHGTNEPYTIGTAVSSGCIRMFNQDIIDLHARVPLDTPVVVLG